MKVDQKRAELMDVAMGLQPADYYIEGARLLNVFSGELIENIGIAVKGSYIAYVGSCQNMIGSETKIISAKGKTAVPGYIDPHAHADMYTNPIAFAESVIALGTTTVLTATLDWATAFGIEGIHDYLELTEELPVKFYIGLPTEAFDTYMSGSDPYLVAPEHYKKFLTNKRVISLAENQNWGLIINKQLLEHIETMRQGHKRIDGHTNGAKDHELNALAAMGVSSCHEALNTEQVLKRLRLGLSVMLRHGSIRRDLPQLLPELLKYPYLNWSKVMLTPDFMNPNDIIDKGYMDYLIQEALKCGCPAVKAYQMSTLHAAIYLGLEEEIGSIAPGKIADILLLKDLENPRPEWVMTNGIPVADKGEILEPLRPMTMRGGNGLGLKRGFFPDLPFDKNSFRISKPETGFQEEDSQLKVPVLRIKTNTITDVVWTKVPIEKDELVLPPKGQFQKLSIISVNRNSLITSFLTGTGLINGAIAATIGIGRNLLTILGTCEEDMARAGNRLYEIGGGIVVLAGGQVRAECALAIGGIASYRSVRELAGEFSLINKACRDLGCSLEEPILTLHFLTSELPFVRSTSFGLMDIKRKKVIFP
ncbi:MAG: adenine deaminase C-terminal domain-containing protein [Desulfitobacteriaceae bacterium]